MELLETQRLRELEEKHRAELETRRIQEEEEAKGDEAMLQKAIREEKEALEEAEQSAKRAREAKDGRSKKEAEEDEKNAQLRARENRNKRLRYNLKVAIKTRDLQRLPLAIEEFKKATLPDDDGDLVRGERILKEEKARDGLNQAMKSRNLKALESSIAHVKRCSFEITLAKELIEANKILLQVRRLERIRAEILELKQSTVAEIRSYQKPPTIVHIVMTSTFLVLGHQEKETRVWKTVQALVGKTGREGLKRRCIGCEPDKINHEAAARAKFLLAEYDLDDVRDVSAGAATFYVWTLTMIEELEARIAAREAGIELDKKPSAQASGRRASQSISPQRRKSSVSRSKSRERKRSEQK